MARAIAERELKKRGAGFVEAVSAGTCTLAGLPAADNAIAVMHESGIDLNEHRSTELDRKLAEEVDLILTMTWSHRQAVLDICPEASEKVYVLSEYAGLKGDVADPYGLGLDIYRRAADQLETLVSLAVDRLLAEG